MPIGGTLGPGASAAPRTAVWRVFPSEASLELFVLIIFPVGGLIPACLTYQAVVQPLVHAVVAGMRVDAPCALPIPSEGTPPGFHAGAFGAGGEHGGPVGSAGARLGPSRPLGRSCLSLK